MNQHMDLNSRVSEKRRELLSGELDELMEVKHMVQGELFQKYFATPLYKKNKELKDAYECSTLAELKKVQGQHWGIKQFFTCVDEVETKIKFIRSDLDKI